MKRRDPWLRANAPSKAVAVPGQVVKTRTELQACLDLVRRPVAQPSAQASLKASLKIQGRKALDGPATRPQTPLAVENGVGNPAALERRPMPVWERECGELPSPICPCPAARPGRDLLFFCVQRSASNPLTQILSRKSSCRFQSLSANLAESVFEPQHSIRKFFI